MARRGNRPEHLPAAVLEEYDRVLADWPEGCPEPAGPRFEAWLGQVARLHEAQRLLDKDGLIVPDVKGNPVPHPALAIEKIAQEQLRAWGDEFTPARALARHRRELEELEGF